MGKNIKATLVISAIIAIIYGTFIGSQKKASTNISIDLLFSEKSLANLKPNSDTVPPGKQYS